MMNTTWVPKCQTISVRFSIWPRVDDDVERDWERERDSCTNLASFFVADDLSALSLVAAPVDIPLVLSDDVAESALVATPVPDVELTSADPEVELALRSAGSVDELTSPDESPSSSWWFLLSVCQCDTSEVMSQHTRKQIVDQFGGRLGWGMCLFW